MNQRQLKACKRLEKALQVCSNAKIYLYVASGTLLAYDAKAIDKHEADGLGDMHDAMVVLQEDAEIIRDFGTRLDGGDF